MGVPRYPGRLALATEDRQVVNLLADFNKNSIQQYLDFCQYRLRWLHHFGTTWTTSVARARRPGYLGTPKTRDGPATFQRTTCLPDQERRKMVIAYQAARKSLEEKAQTLKASLSAIQLPLIAQKIIQAYAKTGEDRTIGLVSFSLLDMEHYIYSLKLPPSVCQQDLFWMSIGSVFNRPTSNRDWLAEKVPPYELLTPTRERAMLEDIFKALRDNQTTPIQISSRESREALSSLSLKLDCTGLFFALSRFGPFLDKARNIWNEIQTAHHSNQGDASQRGDHLQIQSALKSKTDPKQPEHRLNISVASESLNIEKKQPPHVSLKLSYSCAVTALKVSRVASAILFGAKAA